MTMKKKITRIMACVVAGAVVPFYALAQNGKTDGRFASRYDVKGQYLYEDLDLNDDRTSSSGSLEARARFSYTPYDRLHLLSEIRGVTTAGHSFADQETGDTSSTNGFLELREAWAKIDDVGLPGLAAQIGRQRIREPYAFWWNDNIDAARAIYESTAFRGFLGVGENLASYRTSDDDFKQDDKDLRLILAEASWLLPEAQRFELRALYQDDHSGAKAPGARESADDRDDRDADLFWFGARLIRGRAKLNASDSEKFFGYRADLVGVAGDEDLTATSAGAAGSRIIGATRNQDVLGWAFDGAVDFAFHREFLKPVVTLGYAYGSGDDNAADGTDHAFRQTDLRGNSSLVAGSSRPFHQYGEALQPELSNLHIFTLGGTLIPNPSSDISLIYHYYRRDDGAGPLRSTRLGTAPSTSDRDIGHGLDLSYNIDLGKAFGANMPYLKNVSFRSAAGAFRAGQAYGANDGEYAFRGLAEIQARF